MYFSEDKKKKESTDLVKIPSRITQHSAKQPWVFLYHDVTFDHNKISVYNTSYATPAFDWYTVEYPTTHLYFLGINTSLQASVYTKKIQVTCGILHCIPREGVAQLFDTTPYKIKWPTKSMRHTRSAWWEVWMQYRRIYNAYCILLAVFSVAWYKSMLPTSNVINLWYKVLFVNLRSNTILILRKKNVMLCLFVVVVVPDCF